MTHAQRKLLDLLRLVTPHTHVLALREIQQLCIAFDTDWPALIERVEAAIATCPSPFFKSKLAAWLDDTQQEARAA